MIETALLLSVLPTLLGGAWLTLKLTVGVIVVGAVLAFPVAMCRNATSTLPRVAANGYVLFFRGTPALVQLFLLYYGAGQFDIVRHSVLWPVLREPFWCVILALGLNSAAYTGKTLSAALKAVPHGYAEAAHVLGLSRLHTFVLIELPLALRLALPALGNEIILTCKATSLASTVTLLELTGTARLVSSETYAPFEAFLGAGLLYFALNYLLMTGTRRLEATLKTH